MKFDLDKSVTRTEALTLMKEHWHFTPDSEWVPLEDCLGRITAAVIRAANTLPVYRASCFDGVAVRSADFQNGLPDTSAWVRGRDYVRADTGDDFPDEFDTIIAIEDVVLEGEGIQFREGFQYDPNDVTVDPAGTIVKGGNLLMPAHTRITPELTASLAMGGITRAPVLKKPRIAFIPTGSELVPPSAVPHRGQNVEANGIMLKGLLERRGAQFLHCPIVPDDPEALEQALDRALAEADLVLINGGSSRGEEDYNSRMLERRSTFFRHGVRCVPGRPVGFAIIDGKPVLNIPGPVAAAYLAEHWLLSALVNHWYGLPAPKYTTVTAALTVPVKKRPGFEFVARVALERTENGLTATPLSWGEGGIPALLYNTDGFLNVPVDVPGRAEGDLVEIELLKEPSLIP